MFCCECGTQLPDDARFCDNCGTQIAEPPTTPKNSSNKTVLPLKASSSTTNSSTFPSDKGIESYTQTSENGRTNVKFQGKKVSPNITLCPAGIYRWFFEFKMLKNPTILFVILKIFFFIFIGIWLLSLLTDVFSGDFSADSFINLTILFALLLLGFSLFITIVYVGYSLFLGGSYLVLFEMDEQGVKHIHMQQQFKKAQALAWLTALAGLAASRPGTAGSGILAATKNSMYTKFKKTRNVEIIRKYNVIKVNELLNKNQVYAEDEDFDFVCDFIRQQIPKKAAKKM